MKASLQFDPSLDVVANRLPNVFVSRRHSGERIFTDQIGRLARGLDQAGALVIFPEGGNWTPGRWQRIDMWITENRPPGAQAPALSTGPAASANPAASSGQAAE